MAPDGTEKGKDAHFYRQRLPVIERLRTSAPDRTLLFQFRADPPTTTMQRVKGLMTGSLPTFIDAGANFASTAVEEDHLLAHLAAKYPSVHFMGDDTWEHLFAASLQANQTFASDSFRMFDLHTVDNRIQDHLWPLLDASFPPAQENDTPQLVITHFLGVDHCGHTYGPSHPNMAMKLDEMNTILERIVHHVDNDTLLVVMGDHGMSIEGDHGGESVEELMSGLLLYSGQPLRLDEGHHDDATRAYFDQILARIYEQRAAILDIDLAGISARLHYDATAYPLVPQIHLVPTLAYLLNVPIPFGNLGALIPDVLLRQPRSQHDHLMHMVLQFRMNALQVHDYLAAYGADGHAGFAAHELRLLFERLVDADAMLARAMDGKDDTLLVDALLAYDAFLAETMRYCQAIWAQFDVFAMFMGIAVLGAAFLVSLYLWATRASRAHLIDGSILLIACLVQASTLGSNSFVVWEDRGTRFAAATICSWWAARRLARCSSILSQEFARALWKPFCLFLFLRVSSLFGQCREEQLQHCTYMDLPQGFVGQWVGMAAIAAVGVVGGSMLTRFVHGKTQFMAFHALFVAIYASTLVLVAARVAHQTLQLTMLIAPAEHHWLFDKYVPRAVYALCLGGTVAIGLLPRKKGLAPWFAALCLWCTALAMLQQPIGAVMLLILPVFLHDLIFDENDLLVRLALVHLVGHHLFYTTGHQATFPSLPWKAAFIGFDDMHYYTGASLVAMATLAAYMVAWLASWLIILASACPAAHKGPLMLMLILWQSAPTCLSAIFVLILRRHLMTWKIFAPRFLLQALLVTGTLIAHTLSPVLA
ncbi:hypothetical protein BC940DRAFT_256572 [Gongronella butleri]|nr:hypothetical protein BC940DRAFT_256572 [Gongronella butleri]